MFSVYLCAQPKPTLFIYRSIPLLIYIVKQKSKVIVLIAFYKVVTFVAYHLCTPYLISIF